MSFPVRDAIRSAFDYAELTWGGERTGFTEEAGAREVLQRLHEAVFETTVYLKSIETSKREAAAMGLDYDAYLVLRAGGKLPKRPGGR